MYLTRIISLFHNIYEKCLAKREENSVSNIWSRKDERDVLNVIDSFL